MKISRSVIPFHLAAAVAFAGACAPAAQQPVTTSPGGKERAPAARGPATVDVSPHACHITATPIGGCPRDVCGAELEGQRVTGYRASVASPGGQLDITEEGELVIRGGAQVREGRALVGGKLLFRDEAGQERVMDVADYQRVPATDAADGRQVHHRYSLRDVGRARWFGLGCRPQPGPDGPAPPTPET
jgi:hypothetical protein